MNSDILMKLACSDVDSFAYVDRDETDSDFEYIILCLRMDELELDITGNLDSGLA